MFEWILIIIVIAAIFFASDLPKLKTFMEEKGKLALSKAKEKKVEIESKINKDKKNEPK